MYCMPETTKKPARLNALTALRFIAAMLIVLEHARHDYLCLDEWLPERFVFGQVVSFFFILSGFILTYIYHSLSDIRAAMSFFVKRIARLWTLHLAGFGLYQAFAVKAASTVLVTGSGFFVTAANLLMVQAWIPLAEYYLSYNSSSWAISTEFFFYLWFPLMLRFRSRIWIPLVVTGTLVVLSIAFTNWLKLPIFSLNGFTAEGIVFINPIARIFEFVVGMGMALVFEKHFLKGTVSPRPSSNNTEASREASGAETEASEERNAGHAAATEPSSEQSVAKAGKPSSSEVARYTVIEVAIVAFVFALMYYTIDITMLLLTICPPIGEAGGFWLKHSGVSLIGFAFMILVFGIGKGLLSKALMIPPVVVLGETSYAVYLVHFPLLMYRRSFLPQESSVGALVAFLVVLLAFSHILFVYIETPFRMAIIAWFQKRIYKDDPTRVAASSGIKQFLPKITPTRTIGLAVELLTLIAAVIILHPEPKRLTDDQANAFISTEENSLARDIKVGDGLELEALVLKSQRRLAIFDFVFRSTREQPLRYYLYLQLLDHRGTKLFEQPCNFAPRAVTAKEGEQFLETLAIPVERLEDAKQIGIMVVKDDKEIMRFSGGTTDMGQLRLLLPADAVMDKLRGRRISES